MVKKKENSFSRITLSTSLKDKRVLSLARQIIEILSSLGVHVTHDKSLSELKISKESKLISSKEIILHTDLIIAIGGDGTILNCARKYGSKGIALLGVNLGKLGFLSDIAPSEVTTSLIEVIQGKYLEDHRFFLEATFADKKDSFIALNEIVIHSGSIAQLIEFEVYINNVFVYRQKADGIIINTPTGSTAYSLSGGGPIVHPDLEAMTLLPMFPQSLSSSSLVVKADNHIRVVLTQPGITCQVNSDSQDKIIFKGKKEISISRSDSSLVLIHPLGHDFFGGCRNKLGWSMGLVNPTI